jgi:hypothetical protein
MPNLVRSAKGEVLDFDLLLLKQQLQVAPAPTEVKVREDFIDKRMGRRTKRMAAAIVDQQPQDPND